MVCRCVEDKAVGVLQLHTGNHAPHLLTSGEHTDLFLDILVLEEHTTQIGLHRHLVAWSPLREPIDKVHLTLEEGGVVKWQIGGGDGYTPLVGAGICLAVSVDNLEEGSHSLGVMAQEDGLLSFLDGEVHIVEEYSPVSIHSLQSFHFEDLCARLTFHREDDTGIFAC